MATTWVSPDRVTSYRLRVVKSRNVRPWFHLLVDRAPVHPIWLGLGMAVTFAGAVIALHRLLPPDAALLHSEPYRTAIVGLASPYAMIASALVIRAAKRDFDQLKELSTVSAEAFSERARCLTHLPRSSLIGASIVGIGIACLQAFRFQSKTGAGTGEVAIYALCNSLAWVIIWPVLYVGYRSVRTFRSAGRDCVRVDLLKPDSRRPFATFGLRTALSVLAGAPILFIPVAIAGFGRSSWLWNAALFVPAAMLALAALIVPAMGLHRRVRKAKEAELACVDAALTGDRSVLVDSAVAADANRLSLVELMLYRDRIAGIPEWPIDADIVRRFGLYLLIPLVSSVASALVERLVDRVLD